MGLLQWLLLSIRRAFESTLGDSDLLAPVALLRLPQLLPLDAVQLGYPFAFLGVAKPRLLRGCELPFFQRFQITVLGHALGFAAIDDGFSFPCIVRLALEEGDGSTDQAFTVCAKRFQRLFLPLVDALNLAAVDRDGRILVFFEAVHLIAVQGTDLVRLPALLLLLLRFLTLLALGDCGFRSPPDIGGERTSLILLCGDRFGLVSVFRLATELPSRALFFDNGLPVLDTPLGFFSERLLPAFRAFPFLLPAIFGDPPFLRFCRLGLSLCLGLHLFSPAALLAFREFLCAFGKRAELGL